MTNDSVSTLRLLATCGSMDLSMLGPIADEMQQMREHLRGLGWRYDAERQTLVDLRLDPETYRCLVAGCGKPALVANDGAVGGLCKDHNGNVGLKGDVEPSSAPEQLYRLKPLCICQHHIDGHVVTDPNCPIHGHN